MKWANNKVNALSRVPPFLSLAKKRILMNSFFLLNCVYQIFIKKTK